MSKHTHMVDAVTGVDQISAVNAARAALGKL